MPEIFFKNKSTGKRYKVVAMDKEKGVVTLESEHGTFEEPYDKERFIEMGYVLERQG